VSTLKTSVGASYAQLLGVGAYRPTRVVTNEEVCRRIDSSDEWIRVRSGIGTRHWAGPDETIVEMGLTAAEKALAHAGVSPREIDCVVVATFTHLRQTPAAATEIAHLIGTGGAAAFDVSAGCAGFTHALSLGSGMIRSGTARHVLVIGAERMTDLVDPEDRSTAFIFGDGAGAVVMGPSDVPAIGPTVWGSDGSQAHLIAQSEPWDALRGNPDMKRPYLRQDGQLVFRWAVWEMAKIAQRALDAAGLTPGDLDAFIPHQANMRIIDAMARAMKLPAGVAVARDVVTTGNTSGASIPLAMENLLSSGRAPSGGIALLIGFGAGLSYAATTVTLP